MDAADAAGPPRAAWPPTRGRRDAPVPESEGATARNAGLLAVGSLAGRALGLVREITITRLFGQSGRVSAFVVASQIPVMLHDLIVGGYVSAAFVPVLAARLEEDGRPGYGPLVSALLCAFGLMLLGVATLMLWFADPIARVMAGGFARFSPELLDETAAMVRWMTPVPVVDRDVRCPEFGPVRDGSLQLAGGGQCHGERGASSPSRRSGLVSKA